ncbi:DHA2 family efflux MFS transporter permease subunit [Microbacterium sp. zg.Y1090]|nr:MULTISPECIES: DHA2 family efflux MFS transporter permease subunit [unclassified Microbacterium]MCR2814194.1 DHA2 family efflux MFS transporter permease subunit [Microbacterium sp. zg.Y1084]MCR2819997.1 DHA2 family efflux MFS transporter permease subunit [Microbacterium sp. zg.Y1090]MDL5488160.1 DHA2 family efflux MFS transporter permease subunit [Microbacterium sp. zg-Y1211]WIM29752.1 DHA2 family efflux MFS transporter permease subunit [Microbacterium sp. zg-Y1090]
MRPGVVIALLVISAFVVILNETIMSVALPSLMTDLAITASTAQWLTTGFLLTMAIVIPLTGYLLARFPLRRVYLSAMSLFTLGTLIAALAPGFEMLLAGRIVQASGTAIMMPLLFTTVLSIVPATHRGRMMGVISIVIAVAPAIGPTVSGVILSALSWRWLFWIVLPIALIALTLGALWVRNVTETRPAKFDVLSVLLSAVGFGGLIFGLSSIGEAASGNAPVPVWIPLALGILGLVAFVARQLQLQKTDSALLDLRTFTSKSFSLAVTLVVVVMAALFGSLVLLPIYLTDVLGLETLTIGLMLLPGGVLMGVIAPVVGSLFDKYGPTPLVIPGMIVAAAALWGMTTFDESATIPWIIAVHMTLNLGLGFVFTPLLTSALGSLPRSLYPHGSAIVGTIQQVAGAAGTAVFVTLMSVQAAASLAEGASAVSAVASGVHLAFLTGAIVASVAVILAFFVRKPATPDDAPHDEALVAH